jgi:Cu/Ag efflux protein CusF
MKCLAIAAALPLLLAGCETQGPSQGMNMPMQRMPAVNAAHAAPPFVNAEVKAVDMASGQVILAHEDIPNLNMSAMTMPFEVTDKEMLRGVKAGDKIRAQFDMVNGRMVMTRLEHSK